MSLAIPVDQPPEPDDEPDYVEEDAFDPSDDECPRCGFPRFDCKCDEPAEPTCDS